MISPPAIRRWLTAEGCSFSASVRARNSSSAAASARLGAQPPRRLARTALGVAARRRADLDDLPAGDQAMADGGGMQLQRLRQSAELVFRRRFGAPVAHCHVEDGDPGDALVQQAE